MRDLIPEDADVRGTLICIALYVSLALAISLVL